MPDFSLLLTAAGSVAVGSALGWWCGRRAGRLERQRHRRELSQAISESRTDGLTGAANRTAFDERLASQTAVARRYETPCALILIDVDDLKTLNDREGHAAGDEALRKLARHLQTSLRESDLLARYGGDEFALLLPQTDLHGALTAATRILSRLSGGEEHADDPERAGPVALRASLGVAEFCRGETDAELMGRADEALYAAKRAGGGRLGLHDGQRAISAPVTVPATGRSDSSFPPDADRAGRPA